MTNEDLFSFFFLCECRGLGKVDKPPTEILIPYGVQMDVHLGPWEMDG